MYARGVSSGQGDDRKLTLAVSGMLWNRSLVMVDRETKSLWSHLLGRAMRGPLAGTELEQLDGLMTDWQTWRGLHPETTVLKLGRTSRNYRREFYRNPAAFVIGLAEGSAARAWSFDLLQREGVVNDRLGDLPLVVVFDRESSTAFLFDRRVQEGTLTLELDGQRLVDEATRRAWNRRTGRPLDGGKERLKSVPGIVSYRRTWELFHPETTVYEGR